MILDSNIIIYSGQPEYAQLRDYLSSNGGDLQASLITKLEVLGFHKLVPANETDLLAFFKTISILPISDEIITEAIRLKQQRNRSLGDSIIAATGLIYDLPVLTNNTADFLSVSGLRVIALADVLSA